MFHFYQLNMRKCVEPLDIVCIWQQDEHMGCTICSAWKSACFFIHKGRDGAPGLFHPRKTEQCQTAWLEMICAWQLPYQMRVKLRQDAGACSQRDNSGREVTPMWQLLFGPLSSSKVSFSRERETCGFCDSWLLWHSAEYPEASANKRREKST